ncbi:MAG: 5-bromo-4-chloroindolyl phosphate hydrolysis family protein [[Eubacterium] saphenum]|nr:5-bromo-4-chloroindolyl phosphate hydrolysis family protein [[Eubacterium] saphenum]
MKNYDKKETAAGIWSGIISAVLFLVLVFLVKWNFFMCLGISAAVYVGLSLLLRPVKKIGGVSAESIDGGFELLKRLDAAQKGFQKIEDAMLEINDSSVRSEAEQLHSVSAKIVEYLTEHPDRIYAARQFIDYYQETAVKLLSRYKELEASGLRTNEVMRQRADTLDALKTLNRAFEQQFEKLMSNEMTDTDAEIRLLKQTVKMEGIE